jgi:hypothetical protein
MLECGEALYRLHAAGRLEKGCPGQKGPRMEPLLPGTEGRDQRLDLRSPARSASLQEGAPVNSKHIPISLLACLLAYPVPAQEPPAAASLGMEEELLATIPSGVKLESFNFSPDGQHHAFTARDKAFRHFVVLDGKRREDFDDIGRFAFSPDGKKLAFGARKGRQLWWKVLEVK